MSPRVAALCLGLALPACWSSSSPVTPARSHPAAPAAAADSTLDRDVERIGAFLAGGGEPFTSVELDGFTTDNRVVYRTAICDPDELGGRGAYCTVKVCVEQDATPDPDDHCETLVDETVGEPSEPSGPFDPARTRDEIRTAARAHGATSPGHVENTSTVTIQMHGRFLELTAQPWFGTKPWIIAHATLDHETSEVRRFTQPTITSVQISADGACLAIAGTALQEARYESVHGSIRVAFAARRCRP